ncbi:hypothetical protein AU210_016331 [Fusarium oxysporum f. sp. radicis-cucumerinum]|uniref:Uncharacterized protein n=1 Tax=Fusarium oxysporum f. sp. radicis-cucumerinum TaxID=327505 RepID=A0A2H3FRI9_FUSOX|nr:hypothetical protein AU210_016331 [Fusarium oxysporum f. sp. radicis-cucumerinum]
MPQATSMSPSQWVDIQANRLFETATIPRSKQSEAKKQLNDVAENLTTLGIDLSAFNYDDFEPSKLRNIFLSSTFSPVFQYLFGPNWIDQMENMSRLNGSGLGLEECDVNLETFHSYMIERTAAILVEWKKIQRNMQQLEQEGKKDDLRGRWDGLTTFEKRQWFSERFPKMPEHSHPDIRAYVQVAETELANLDSSVFKTPSLNAADLSHGLVLLDLLDTRVKHHPATFRASDGRSVSLGIWAGCCQPPRVEGVLTFPEGKELENADDYPFSFQSVSHTNGSQTEQILFRYRPDQVQAGIGFCQVGAQLDTYRFLSQCLQELLEDGSLTHPEGLVKAQADSREHDSGLLTRCFRASYAEHPQAINMEWMYELLSVSLDRARDDFRQLRALPEEWKHRMVSMPTRPPGRAANFIRFHIDRIDLFSTLLQRMEQLKDKGLFDPKSYPYGDPKILNETTRTDVAFDWTAIGSLSAALKFILEERLSRLNDLAWAIPDSLGGVARLLLEMLRRNEATLRVMYIPAVLRLIDEEIAELGAEKTIPYLLTEELCDISVLAACLRESEKFHRLVTDTQDYYVWLMGIEKKWNEQARPWKQAADAIISTIDKETAQRLSVRIGAHRLRSKHARFWDVMEGCIETAREGAEPSTRSAYENIQELCSPDPAVSQPSQPAEDMQFTTFAPLHSHDQPSQTQVRRAAKKSSLTAYDKPQQPHLEHDESKSKGAAIHKHDVYLQAKADFWRHLVLPSHKSNSEFRWQDFEKAMMEIGYKSSPQTGSIYRFDFVGDVKGSRPTALSIHKPHTPHTAKIPAHKGRWWLARIRERLTLHIT